MTDAEKPQKTRAPKAVSQLLPDQGGATMVMGVFMGAFLVGLIYYVWGVGSAITFRERMQDAADTGAFDAAVVHARGMNVMVLLNIIMQAFAIIATMFDTVANIMLATTIAAGLECLGCGPWCTSCCEACPAAIEHGFDTDDAYDTAGDVHDTVEDIISALHTGAVAVRNGVPFAAQAKVIGVSGQYHTPTEIGFMAPLASPLPMIDDDRDWPCHNKVALWAGLAAAAYAPIRYGFDRWVGEGVVLAAWTAYFESEDWCPDNFQRVDPDTHLGGDDYQLRAIMFGTRHFQWTRQGVAVSTWGLSEGDGNIIEAASILQRFSIAQAEYYYEAERGGDTERDEWAWHMNWRARLRRVRLGSGGGGVAGAAPSGISGLSSFIDVTDLLVH